ncbi:transcriptional regulator with XRE-family HTH domain [Erwinia persicina]|nr:MULTISPECIES: LexA family transcriptional regulator [Erwinia]MCP1440615.1 transcriptional regulator with XRE-family HTH domain [Erwinia persicina]MDN4626046.1 LexA family transcriptional regulator [Erwinia sp. PsM31]MDN8542321.1 LexA family transcriptional regulator [Erwinia sp. BC051422]
MTKNTRRYKFWYMKPNTLAYRLNMAMTMMGITQGALAKASGVSQPTIWRLTKGEAEGSRKLVDIARALDVNVQWLASGEGEMRGNAGLSAIDKVKSGSTIPVWGPEGKTGEIVSSPNGVKAKKTWRAYILDRNSGCAEATTGSIVIVDTDVPPESGDLVMARVSSRISVYRYLEGPSNGFLTVDDPRLPAVELSDESELIGVAIFLIRDLRR